MRHRTVFVGLLFLSFQFPEARAQQPPWWFSCEFGEGLIQLSSDQQQGDHNGNFAIEFAGGHSIGGQLRGGVNVKGWVSQKYDLNDPRTGEGVAVVGGVLDGFPVRRLPLFFRGGIGEAFYEYDKNALPPSSDQPSQPTGHNGQGLGWEAGGGYEFPVVPGFLSFAPVVEYAAGSRGDVRYSDPPEIGRRYSVVEFKVAMIFKWGWNRKPPRTM